MHCCTAPFQTSSPSTCAAVHQDLSLFVTRAARSNGTNIVPEVVKVTRVLRSSPGRCVRVRIWLLSGHVLPLRFGPSQEGEDGSRMPDLNCIHDVRHSIARRLTAVERFRHCFCWVRILLLVCHVYQFLIPSWRERKVASPVKREEDRRRLSNFDINR